MYPYIELFGRLWPSYALMGIAGFGLGMLYLLLVSRHYGLSADDAVYLYVLGGAGCLVGAKALYLLTVLPSLAEDIRRGLPPSVFISKYISGGMVYYGGFLGAILAAFWAARYLRLRLDDFFPVLMPPVALFAGFGRIGCFLTGCCWGIETRAGLGIRFEHSIGGPNGVYLLPVQLMEAGFDFFLMVVLIFLAERRGWRARLLPLYGFSYGIWRFMIEFFRGDALRGIYLGLSTSQWISAFLVGIFAFLLFKKKGDKKR